MEEGGEGDCVLEGLKIWRRRRARVVLPEDEGPERAIIRVVGLGFEVGGFDCDDDVRGGGCGVGG